MMRPGSVCICVSVCVCVVGVTMSGLLVGWWLGDGGGAAIS